MHDRCYFSIGARDYNPPTGMPLNPGSRLETYELLQPLGSAAWAKCGSRASYGSSAKLPSTPTGRAGRKPLRVSRFEQEARAASALSHLNICHIYALGETTDGQLFIAMEYVDGETLRVRLRRARLAMWEALDLAIQ